LIVASLATIGYGEREGQQPRVQDIEAPLGTVVTANKHALVAAHLVDMGHGELCSTGARRWSNGIRSLETPLNSVTASSVPSALTTAFFEQANGGFYDGKWQKADEPMHTLLTKGHMGLVQSVQVPADCLAPKHRETARRCAELLREHLPEHFAEPAELVLMRYGGIWWALVDITLRMLKPHELYRAQAFPDDYIIHEIPDPRLLFKDGVQVADPLTVSRVPLTITAQIRMCGNSVSPVQAEALVRANFQHEATFMEIAA